SDASNQRTPRGPTNARGIQMKALTQIADRAADHNVVVTKQQAAQSRDAGGDEQRPLGMRGGGGAQVRFLLNSEATLAIVGGVRERVSLQAYPLTLFPFLIPWVRTRSWCAMRERLPPWDRWRDSITGDQHQAPPGIMPSFVSSVSSLAYGDQSRSAVSCTGGQVFDAICKSLGSLTMGWVQILDIASLALFSGGAHARSPGHEFIVGIL